LILIVNEDLWIRDSIMYIVKEPMKLWGLI
jgi:hypothetical protein